MYVMNENKTVMLDAPTPSYISEMQKALPGESRRLEAYVNGTISSVNNTKLSPYSMNSKFETPQSKYPIQQISTLGQ